MVYVKKNYEVHVLVQCVGLWQVGKGILIWRLHVYSPNEENLVTQFLKWKLFHVIFISKWFYIQGHTSVFIYKS
jgi:hypothetical protein